MLFTSISAAAADEDKILYRYRGETLTTSEYGPIAAFQKSLDEKLQTCVPAGPRVVSTARSERARSGRSKD
jgi:hypothetical protein